MKTRPVGSYPQGASSYGVLDMAGNVWEWVADWYDPGFYQDSPPRISPGAGERSRAGRARRLLGQRRRC